MRTKSITSTSTTSSSATKTATATAYYHHRRKSEIKRLRLPIPMVAMAVLGALIWLLGISFMSHSALQTQQQVKNHKVMSPNVVADHYNDLQEHLSLMNNNELWVDNYQDPGFFESLHACVADCHSERTKPTKIALLYPPGSISLIFVDFIHEIAQAHAKHPRYELTWIPTSHLPSSDKQYSHIVRFATIPVLMAVGDALLHVAPSADDITVTDIQETTKLILVWHCHISKLADSKTAPVLTMTMEEIEEDPIEQEMFFRAFLPAFDPFEEDFDAHIDVEGLVMSLEEIIERIRRMLKPLDMSLTRRAAADDNAKKGNNNQRGPKNLQSIVDDVSRKVLQSGECRQFDLQPPTSPMAKQVYQFLKHGSHTDDELICKSGTMLSNSFICRTLTPPFDTESLFEESQKQK